MRGWVSIATVSSMPGFSLRSGLGSTARTVTARVAGSITGAIVAIWPRKGWSGKAAARATIGWPGRVDERIVSGTGEASLSLLMSRLGTISSPGFTTVPRGQVLRDWQERGE